MGKKAKTIAVLAIVALVLLLFSWFARLPLLGTHPHEAIPRYVAMFASLTGEQVANVRAGQVPSLFSNVFFPRALQSDLLDFEAAFGQKITLPTNQSLYFAAVPTRSSGIDLLFVVPGCRGLDLGPALRSLPGARVRSSTFRSLEVFTVEVGGKHFSFAKFRNLLLFGRHAYLVENAISQLQEPRTAICHDAGFRQVFAAGKKEAGYHIYVNISELGAQFAPLIEPAKLDQVTALAHAGEWLHFHFPEKKSVSEWKMAFAPAPGNPLLAASKNSDEIDFKSAFQALPSNLTGFAWLSIARLRPGVQEEIWEKYFRPWATDEAILAVGEQLDKTTTETFFLLKTKDASRAEAALETFSSRTQDAETYDFQLFKVRQLPGPQVAAMLGTGSMFTECWAAVLGDYVLLANSKAGIDRWLGLYLAGQTFAQDVPFLQSLRSLPATAQVFVYFESAMAWQFIGRCLTEQQLAAFSQSPLQFQHLAAAGSWRGKILECTAVTSVATQTGRGPANVLWQASLLGNAVGSPLVFPNPATGEAEVLVRDDGNRVYLFSRSGRLLWRRDIEGPIRSDFTQINLQNDRERQWVFNTPSAIYVLDGQGNDVPGYPLQLQVPATNGVAVVDFFQSNDYHFFIACENGNAYGFDERGSPVEGWRPNQDVGTVAHPVLHFQAQGMDFLCLLDVAGTLRVYQKNGSDRFPPVELGSYFLQTPDFQVQRPGSRIVVCDDRGKVHVVNLQGNAFGLQLTVGNNEGVQFAFADVTADERKDYLALSGKDLAVYAYEGNDFTKKISHSFPWPQDDLFGVTWAGRTKQYLGTVSVAKKRIFLMDGKGRIPEQFPLEGTTPFAVTDLLSDGRPVVLTGNGRSVCAYIF